jgi:DNA-binding LacI/PurR family transcriptional regulator/serine phosphatase RsbU (regulator of sigma subunit)
MESVELRAGGTPAKRWTIAVLTDHMLVDYQDTILFGAGDELRESGATVVFFCGGIIESPDPTWAQRNRMFECIDRRRFDGVLVLAPIANHIGPEGLAAYCERFAPLPVCALSVELPGHPSVVVDNVGGMRQIIEHMLVTHQRRRVAFVRGPQENEEAERRFTAYREALVRHDVAFDPTLVVLGTFGHDSGVDAVRVLCDERGVAFDALVAANDEMALGAIEAMQARGIDVPRQVAVAGFDDVDEARFATPPLTTIRQPLYDSGRRAARLLTAMLRKERVPARVVLDTLIVLRESCGCTVDQAVVPDPNASFAHGPSLAAHLTSRRETTLEALTTAVSVEHARIAPDWAEPLFEAFLTDVRDGAGERFIAVLDATLRRVVAAGGSIRPWHAVVSVLSNASMSAVGDPAATYRADEILHRARVLIGDLRERVQAQHRIRRERWIRTLHETSEALMTAFGADALVQAVAKQLPRLQIPACALAAYDRDGSRAHALFLYDDDRQVESVHGSFEAAELAPASWLDARPRTLVAQPLVFHGEQLGFALFEVGPREGVVYEGLRELVSSAMKGARLVDQVVEEATRRQRAERERLEKEMEIAARIQTTIVPKRIEVPGLDMAAVMIPATEVGGDYYDVIPFEGGCWIGVGDVAGHGLQTGLVMLMIQSMVAALVRRSPRASPSEVIGVLNAVMYDNVHRRMSQDEHATLSLLRYDGGGRFVCAGAHEDIVIHRAATGRCEQLETRGPWVGAFPDVRRMLVESSFVLAPGDVMVLYTDGVTEARDARGVQFGPDRLSAIVESVADQPVQDIRDHLTAGVRSWAAVQDDDMSLVVVRLLGPG